MPSMYRNPGDTRRFWHNLYVPCSDHEPLLRWREVKVRAELSETDRSAISTMGRIGICLDASQALNAAVESCSVCRERTRSAVLAYATENANRPTPGMGIFKPVPAMKLRRNKAGGYRIPS